MVRSSKVDVMVPETRKARGLQHHDGKRTSHHITPCRPTQGKRTHITPCRPTISSSSNINCHCSHCPAPDSPDVSSSSAAASVGGGGAAAAAAPHERLAKQTQPCSLRLHACLLVRACLMLHAHKYVVGCLVLLHTQPRCAREGDG